MDRISDYEGVSAGKGSIDRELWLNDCQCKYDNAIEAVNELGKINEWGNLAKSIEKQGGVCPCPVCLVDEDKEISMSLDMAFPPAPPWVFDKNDPLEDMGLCMSCKECGHKNYVEFRTATKTELKHREEGFDKIRKKRRHRRKRKR